jgi:NAD(P)-dependent dehydrogenase (short-subunit alcohol dehydrogenase family)
MPEGKLAGKVAIVTGASTGIGRAAVIGLAAAGAKVCAIARSSDALDTLVAEVAAQGGEAVAHAGDVADPAVIQSCVEQVVAKWGRLDILVANAGVNTKQRNLRDMSREQWDYVVGVNLSGVFHCAQAALEPMRQQQEGTIIITASMAGKRAGVMSGVAYGATKSGAVSLAHSINAEERINGIRATALCPGEVATPILDLRPNPPPMADRENMLQPEDLADTIVFLASLHQRVTIDELWINPTIERNRTSDEAPKKA